jgi:ribosomal protein L37AE/L43A
LTVAFTDLLKKGIAYSGLRISGRYLMLKMECPDCLKSFIWTDSMPLKGKCPTIDCEWNYDVHQELKKSVTKREDESKQIIRCPHCYQPISSTLTICESCGEVIVGSKFFQKKYILLAVAAVLIILSLVYKFW